MARRLVPEDLANIRRRGIDIYNSQIYNINRQEFFINRDIYGSPLETSRFICITMGLDIPEDQYGNYDRVVEAALERLNEVKTEIHFTPNENDDVYRKLRFIYDKIVSDNKNDICNMLKLRATHELCKRMTNEQVIQESSQILSRYGIEIDENLKMGEKIKYIEDKIYELRVSGRMPKGGNKRSKKINKSRRRNKSKSRIRNKSKRYKK
jgi:hypothetical protein